MATLLEIRDKVRQRADIQRETARYPDVELDKYINDSYKKLYGILVRNRLHRDEANQTITADGSATYDLPADHFATVGVFKQEDEYYRRLKKFDQRMRPHGATSAVTGEAGKYRIARVAGTKTIELYPRPQDGVYIHSYAPILADLSADTDTLESVLSWDEYVVIDASIKALRKENTDTRELKSDLMEVYSQIVADAAAEELSETYKVERTRTRRGDYIDSADFWWCRDGDRY
jgi:hypothetical protein